MAFGVVTLDFVRGYLPNFIRVCPQLHAQLHAGVSRQLRLGIRPQFHPKIYHHQTPNRSQHLQMIQGVRTAQFVADTALDGFEVVVGDYFHCIKDMTVLSLLTSRPGQQQPGAVLAETYPGDFFVCSLDRLNSSYNSNHICYNAIHAGECSFRVEPFVLTTEHLLGLLTVFKCADIRLEVAEDMSSRDRISLCLRIYGCKGSSRCPKD